MTIVAGLAANDGLVLASDSLLSTTQTARTGQKIWAIGPYAVALAGAESLMQELLVALRALTPGSPLASVENVRADIRSKVTGRVAPVFNDLRRVQPQGPMPGAEAAIAAFVGGQPRLFTVNESGHVTHEVPGIAALGSAAQFAEHAVILFQQLTTAMTLHQAQLLAYRIIESAIAAGGRRMGVGGPVQMAVVRIDRADLLEPNEPFIREAVQNWVAAVAEQFQSHRPPGEGP